MRYFFVIIFFLLSNCLWSQVKNDFDVEFNSFYIPDNGSNASIHSTELELSILKKLIKKGQKGVVNIAFNYNYTHLDYKIKNALFEDLDNFHSVGFTSVFFRRLKNPKWSFVGILNPELNSNFSDGIKGDDFNINLIALFNYSKQQNTRLSFGLVYTNNYEMPAPIPVISYWKKFNETWEMNLGFPQTYLSHHFNKKSSLAAFVELQSYSGNISENINSPTFVSQRTAEQIIYKDIITGLQFRYKLKNFQLTLKGGYTINRSLKLEDSDFDIAYRFDMDNNFTAGVDISFNF